MILPKATFLFAGLLSTVLAAVNTTQEFLIHSQVVDGPARFGGLYVSVYHTGAGTNDLVLGSKANASKAFLNSTQLQWDLGTPDTPWGISLTSASNYVAWQSITVNTGFGDTGVFLWPGVSAKDSITLNNGQWAGWIVCDWSHGVPQLFYQYSYTKYALPDSCSAVALFPEYI